MFENRICEWCRQLVAVPADAAYVSTGYAHDLIALDGRAHLLPKGSRLTAIEKEHKTPDLLAGLFGPEVAHDRFC